MITIFNGLLVVMINKESNILIDLRRLCKVIYSKNIKDVLNENFDKIYVEIKKLKNKFELFYFDIVCVEREIIIY